MKLCLKRTLGHSIKYCDKAEDVVSSPCWNEVCNGEVLHVVSNCYECLYLVRKLGFDAVFRQEWKRHGSYVDGSVWHRVHAADIDIHWVCVLAVASRGRRFLCWREKGMLEQSKAMKRRLIRDSLEIARLKREVQELRDEIAKLLVNHPAAKAQVEAQKVVTAGKTAF